MNTKVIYKMLLLVSIVLQSFTAASSTFDFHQVDIEHLQTVHDHASDNQITEDLGLDEHNIEDCHHCGHCSGSHLCWIGGKPEATDLAIMHHHNFQKLTTIPFHISSGIYRPPIT